MLCHQDVQDVECLSERDEIERHLVRDTEAYLDERAHGLTPLALARPGSGFSVSAPL